MSVILDLLRRFSDVVLFVVFGLILFAIMVWTAIFMLIDKLRAKPAQRPIRKPEGCE